MNPQLVFFNGSPVPLHECFLFSEEHSDFKKCSRCRKDYKPEDEKTVKKCSMHVVVDFHFDCKPLDFEWEEFTNVCTANFKEFAEGYVWRQSESEICKLKRKNEELEEELRNVKAKLNKTVTTEEFTPCACK